MQMYQTDETAYKGNKLRFKLFQTAVTINCTCENTTDRSDL